MVIDTIASDPQWESLAKLISGRTGVAHLSGLWGSAAPLVAVCLARATRRTSLYVTAHLEEADASRDDIEFFLGGECTIFPAWEGQPCEDAAGGEIQAERLRACIRLGQNRTRGMDTKAPSILVAPIQALMQPVPTLQALNDNTLRLCVDAEPERTEGRSPTALLAWAIERGFERLELVESPGDVAVRGDLVDLFVPGESAPFRIQFLDHQIESIRRFDVSTQRSIESLDAIAVTAVARERPLTADRTTDLTDYLPRDAVVLLDRPAEIQTFGETWKTRLGESIQTFAVREILGRLARFPMVYLSSFGAAATSDETSIDLGVASISRFEGTAAESVGELCRMTRDHEVHVVCDTEGERDRLEEMIRESTSGDGRAKPPIRTHLGVMHRGFEWTRTHTLVIPHHELFHRHRQRRRVRRIYAGRPLDTWLELKPGERVVHVVHGIAVYRGLKKMRKGASQQLEEFLCLEFADKARVFVPCSQIDLVQKYIGAGGRRPELSKLGGKRWSRAKEQAADAVSELAESLLRIQALRNDAVGTAYPGDTEWQREFEAAFPYDETEDQLVVAREIREDLQRPRSMDRVVCGDVGYGKTELAMRAAFKVMEYGRQVAVLVPTTVLAEQHYTTFRERMAEYPFRIACLSRFRSPAEQRKIVEEVRKGQADVVIGTHRLLSKDVAFPNLGLAIIDEEQRFGVEHKERLKSMRETIDVLTLTATPIPRTLHMSLMGIRDISSLQTPPMDRRAIATRVTAFQPTMIREAILREMNRDGQIYFVHNFVHSIAAFAERIQELVPEARVVHAHGQMHDDELEAIMHRFVERQADVLVTTTIIESGIDIPTVNTIFINRADRFGLADLHQLRGRVGRSSHRAYCYLLLSPDHPPTGKAAKRLKTIEEFSELGAGFRIAMRDLEIRGAGNLLGKEQSGHIAAVGYEMYCRLLEQTIRRLKNEPDPTPPPVHLDLDVAAHIPQHYIASDRSRMEVYRRMVSCRTEPDLAQLERDLQDAFGTYPVEVKQLLQTTEIRVYARRFGINTISLRPPDVVFTFDDLKAVEPVFADTPGSVRIPDPKTIHLRLPPKYLEPTTLVAVLRRMLSGSGVSTGAPA